MITKIEVNGFRSLSDFKLNLQPGVNILVGPNGSGKTNIILFFEFLAYLTSDQIGDAVSKVGGAGSIFKKIGNEKYQDFIYAKIYGASQISSKLFIVYEYDFQVNISFENDNLFFSKQSIKIRTASKFWDNPESKNYGSDWDLNLLYQSNEESNQIDVITIKKEKIRARFIYGDVSQKKLEKELKEHLKSYNLSYFSILHAIVRVTEYFRIIRLDLKGGETFNIVPSKVKELEDSAATPEIKKDGSGLATTLYAMKKSKPRIPRRLMSPLIIIDEPSRKMNLRTLERIVSFLRLANSTIKDLSVDNDPFSNKLLVKITIQSGEYHAILPLAAMSDGTIKWLTLITAIITSKTIFSIEEPENFLHPWMQAEIVNIMRDQLLEKKYSFVLMTTHSESLLNHANPEEIIIVSFDNGKTEANKIQNTSAIRNEISNTGFGLGYFYFSNALTNE